VLVGTGGDGEVNSSGGLGGHLQALLRQGIAWSAQDEQSAWVEGEPYLVGVGDAVAVPWRPVVVQEVESDRLVAGQEGWHVVFS
jgi:hypothetical protein